MTSAEIREHADAFLATLPKQKKKVRRPRVYAMVGLVGAGKSTVAREIAEKTGGVIIRTDAIRRFLPSDTLIYSSTDIRNIAGICVGSLVQNGHSVVLDADCVSYKTRMRLKAIERSGVPVYSIRVVSDLKKQIERLSKYPVRKTIHRTHAHTPVFRSPINALTCMSSRLPLHYRWDQRQDELFLKKLSFPIHAVIDTSNKSWKTTLASALKNL